MEAKIKWRKRFINKIAGFNKKVIGQGKRISLTFDESTEFIEDFDDIFTPSPSNRVGTKEFLKANGLSYGTLVYKDSDKEPIFLSDLLESFSNTTKGTQEGLTTEERQREKYAELRERHGMFEAIPLYSKWLLSRLPKEQEGWISVGNALPPKEGEYEVKTAFGEEVRKWYKNEHNYMRWDGISPAILYWRHPSPQEH